MRAFIVLLLVAVASAELAPLFKNSEPIPGKYIIKLEDESNIDEIASAVRLFGGRIGNTFRYALRGFAAALSDDILDVVRRLPAVEYVEQDGIYRTQAVGSWGLDRIDQRSLPLDNSYSLSRGTGNGSGKTVWVIDTGVNPSHNDFGGRAEQVVNFFGEDEVDCNGHGTHCAGTVGSNTYGVANGVQIKGVKVFGCFGRTTNEAVLSGVDYVTQYADKSHSIASMSLGGGASNAMDQAVQALIDSGVPTAVAAGNEDQNACNVSPARLPDAITVGATDINDDLYVNTNWGQCLDIFAPGVAIKSLWYNSNTATNTISGTSMACPHVAGALALYDRDTASMLGATSNDKIRDIPFLSGSPNKLLYVQ